MKARNDYRGTISPRQGQDPKGKHEQGNLAKDHDQSYDRTSMLKFVFAFVREHCPDISADMTEPEGSVVR